MLSPSLQGCLRAVFLFLQALPPLTWPCAPASRVPGLIGLDNKQGHNKCYQLAPLSRYGNLLQADRGRPSVGLFQEYSQRLDFAVPVLE
jgi:hypothetical protein